MADDKAGVIDVRRYTFTKYSSGSPGSIPYRQRASLRSSYLPSAYPSSMPSRNRHPGTVSDLFAAKTGKQYL
jgi:hypothetical protein